MSPNRSFVIRLARAGAAGYLSAWTMAIVFATVAMISFAIDQTIVLLPVAEEESDSELPSLLHPVLLLQSLINAAAKPADRVNERRP